MVDNSDDPSVGRAVWSVLPEGAVRNRRHRDHIKDLRSTPVASGASLSGPDGFGRSRRGDDRPTDCDRHPGVGTSVGRRASGSRVDECKRLAAAVGKLASFSSRGKELSKRDLDACNRVAR